MNPIPYLQQIKNNPYELWWFPYSQYQRKILRRKGVDIVSADWDNLLILDGCRYDTFEEEYSSSVDWVISAGSNTEEFLHSNFGDDKFPEIVYVSANAQISKIEAKFHERVRLWETKWDEEANTVLPNDVKKSAIDSAHRFPNKRLIVHFMQPHYPFIGKTGRTISHRGQFGTDNDPRIWQRLKEGEVGKEKVQEAYHENLQIVLDEVDELLSVLNGKTVISSDHGNEFGQFGLYGHPGQRYSNGLVKVPWLEYINGGRKDILSGEAKAGPSQSKSEIINNRLRDLGYL